MEDLKVVDEVDEEMEGMDEDEYGAPEEEVEDDEDDVAKEIVWNEVWKDVEGGEEAPSTPRMSPKEEEEKSKGLSQGEDGEEFKCGVCGEEEGEEGRKPSKLTAAQRVSKEERNARFDTLSVQIVVQILRRRKGA